jgi:glutathionylspermidine synthase
MCDFYKILSVKDGNKGSSSIYIIYAEEEMICQKYYCLSYLHTSYIISGPLDRVKLSASGIITKIIIFDNLLNQKKIKFARITHIYIETDLITMRRKN